jgi:acetyltransferase, GNAT family
MNIRPAQNGDIAYLTKKDVHIRPSELQNLIVLKRILLLEEERASAGWLRYSLFWDNTPFMNLLYVEEPFRGRGLGKALVQFWENQMAAEGFTKVMTSTQANETAQYFYRHLGYKTIGGFLPPGEEYELFFYKNLDGEYL